MRSSQKKNPGQKKRSTSERPKGEKQTTAHKAYLQVLLHAKPSVRQAILKTADKALIYSICEVCDNTLAGNAPLTRPQVQQLKRYRKIIESLASRGESWIKKRRTLVRNQKGGAFLPLLLGFLAPVVGKLLFGT